MNEELTENLLKIIANGEGTTIEFKEAKNNLPKKKQYLYWKQNISFCKDRRFKKRFNRKSKNNGF